MTMEKTNKLAQPADSMFERNVAIIASRKQEVRVFSDGFVYEGFICGLDEQWVQLYGHEENDRDNMDERWRFLLVLRSNISAIGRTGRDLTDYSSDDTSKWIDDKICVFADNVASNFISSNNKVRGNKNDNKREDI